MPLGFSSGRPLTPLIAATSARSSATARLSAAFSARSRSVRASSSARGRPERVIFPEADMAGTGRVHDGTAQPRQFTSARPFAPRTPTIALMGSSLSDTQVALLREHCPALRFVTVMLDAGAEDAAEKVAGRLAWHWPVRSITLPDGTQPDTIAEVEVLALLGRR